MCLSVCLCMTSQPARQTDAKHNFNIRLVPQPSHALQSPKFPSRQSEPPTSRSSTSCRIASSDVFAPSQLTTIKYPYYNIGRDFILHIHRSTGSQCVRVSVSLGSSLVSWSSLPFCQSFTRLFSPTFVILVHVRFFS